MNFLNLIQGAAGKVKGVATLLSGLTKTQAIIAGVATVTAVGGVGTGGYFLYDHFHQPEPIVADVVISTEVAEPTEEVVAVEEVVTEETEAAEPETVTLVGSSIEKDLKIKIQDESSKNVKGQPFEITIKADKKKAKSTTYSDDDKDGIIYIKSIDAGKYDVSLNEIDGYISKENSYKVTVKDKIEYTKVDVKDEIKSAAEVAPAEDAEVDNVEVEAVIQDTVETVDSTCTPSKVGAGDVDTSNFPTASVGGSTKVDIPQAAEEINVPPKKIGKMLILSVILAVVFYALVIIAVGLVLDSGAIIKSQEATGLVTADAMGTAFGMKIMAKVVIVGGMCGIITSWNSFLIGGSRAMYSMAESYMIPKTFAKLHPKHKTPINALILIGVLTMLAPFAGRQLLVWISDAGNFACCLAYCMVAVSFMILRKKEPDMPRPYKVPAYKFFGTMAVIMSGFMVCMYCIPGSGGSLILPEWGMVGAWSLLGVVFYVVCKRKYKESFGDLVELISDEDAATLMPEADDEELDKVIDAAIDRVLASI